MTMEERPGRNDRAARDRYGFTGVNCVVMS
jgi:hypothetical protein